MWLSKRTTQRPTDDGTLVGEVTIGGDHPGVYMGGERRNLPVCAPGGYFWMPKVGDETLVIKCVDGMKVCTGLPMEKAPDGMEAGEVTIRSDGDTVLWLKNDGTMEVRGDVELTGDVQVEGDIQITGTVNITGGLVVNGHAIG